MGRTPEYGLEDAVRDTARKNAEEVLVGELRKVFEMSATESHTIWPQDVDLANQARGRHLRDKAFHDAVRVAVTLIVDKCDDEVHIGHEELALMLAAAAMMLHLKELAERG